MLWQRGATAVLAALFLVVALALGAAGASDLSDTGAGADAATYGYDERVHTATGSGTADTGETPTIGTNEGEARAASGDVGCIYDFDRSLVAPSRVPGVCLRSFSAGTEVLLGDGTTTKSISEMEVGDQVWATDPETGESGPRRVEAVWPHYDWLLDLDVEGGSVTTTEDHRFWNATDREWQETRQLDADDRLLTPNGSFVAAGSLDWSTWRYDQAYDLTIDGLNSFYVGAGTDAVLVHNCLSPYQMNQTINKGIAPRGLKRVDTGKVPGEQTHIHFDSGAALNIDGTWKNGSSRITNKQRKWLEENGWVVP